MSLPRRTSLFGCASLLLAALHGPAYAQSYEAALLDGVSARDRAMETGSPSDWQRAAEHFDRARELRSTKQAEFEFAEAALRVDRWLEACAAYEAALDLGLEGKAAERARAFLAARASEIARLAFEGPPGSRVQIGDGASIELPLRRPVVVRPGSMELRAELNGFHSRRWRVDIAPSSTVTVFVQLEPLPAPSPPPALRPRKPAVESQGEPPEWAVPMTLTGGSLVVAGGALALTTSLMLPGERRELRDLCAQFAGDECASAAAERRDRAQSVANRIETLENVRWVALSAAGVGLVGVAVGLVPLLRGEEESVDGARQMTLRVSDRDVSIEWQGRF